MNILQYTLNAAGLLILLPVLIPVWFTAGILFGVYAIYHMLKLTAIELFGKKER
jgi:hypothetical protein